MTTQLINQTTDFSATVLTNVTELQFTNAAGLATATFADTQFGTQISSDVLITGNIRLNRIEVILSGASFDASAWQFAFWSGSDEIFLDGSLLAETVIGSVRDDIIQASDGADTIRGHMGTDRADGGAGNDIFLFDSDEAEGAETILGGDDTDTIVVFGGDRHDLSGASISGIENLSILGNTTAVISALQIGLTGIGRIETVTGGAGSQNLVVDGNSVNLSATQFSLWNSDFDTITIVDATNAVGSNENELFIDNGQGVVNLNGSGGDDTFVYSGPNSIIFNDIIVGGSGIDTLTFEPLLGIGIVYDLDILAAMISVEILEFSSLISMTLRTSDQGLDEVTTIKGHLGSILEVELQDSDSFFATDFTMTSLFRLTVLGDIRNNTITGRNGLDSLDGGAGDDTIEGGGGADILIGGSAVDLLSYGTSSAGVTINLDSGRAQGGDAAGDLFSDFESVLGSAFADNLRGDAGENTLRGGSGDDSLNGAGGTDQLRGAGGSDLFIFQNARGSKPNAARDEIVDFAQGIDRIDLSQIDAIAGGADDDFTFQGLAGFGPAAGLRYEVRANKTIVFGDVDADQVADFSIGLQGVFTLTAADFIL